MDFGLLHSSDHMDGKKLGSLSRGKCARTLLKAYVLNKVLGFLLGMRYGEIPGLSTMKILFN